MAIRSKFKTFNFTFLANTSTHSHEFVESPLQRLPGQSAMFGTSTLCRQQPQMQQFSGRY